MVSYVSLVFSGLPLGFLMVASWFSFGFPSYLLPLGFPWLLSSGFWNRPVAGTEPSDALQLGRRLGRGLSGGVQQGLGELSGGAGRGWMRAVSFWRVSFPLKPSGPWLTYPALQR